MIDATQQRRNGFVELSINELLIISKRRQRLFQEMDQQQLVLSNSNSISVDHINTIHSSNNTVRKKEALKDLAKRIQFSQTLCIPEWMIEIPDDLKENWVCIPRPDGKRFILSSKRGKTVLYNLSGYSKVVKSNLPGGSFYCFSYLITRLNFRGNCVLDVIQGEHCFYVMDVLSYNNTNYEDSEAESRLFIVSSRVEAYHFANK